MDNQNNDQKSIKQTSTSTTTESPITPILETPNNSVSETTIPVVPEPPIPETPVPETELPPLQPQTEIEETVPSNEYKNEYQDILNQYAANKETTAPTLENETPPSPPPTPTITDSDIFPKPPQNNIFKIIFIFSLIVFISTATILAFVYFKNQNNQESSTTKTIETIPTQTVTDTCFLNDKTYQAGETFTATDGCNTCTCVSQNNISCTDKECLSSKSATESATTITPTKTSTTSTSSAKKTTSTQSATIK